MSAHTPGPWFNTSQDDTPMGEVMDQPLDSGTTMHVSISGPNAKADARLVAVAPRLLHCLQRYVAYEYYINGDEARAIERYREACAVIDKATGAA